MKLSNTILTAVKPLVSVQAVAGVSSGIHPAASTAYKGHRGPIGIVGAPGVAGIPGIDRHTAIAKDAIMRKLGIDSDSKAEVLQVYRGFKDDNVIISLTLSSEYYDLNTIDNRSNAFKMLQKFHSLAYEYWGLEKVTTSLRNFRGPEDQSLDCNFEVATDRLHFCLERGEKIGYETGIL